MRKLLIAVVVSTLLAAGILGSLALFGERQIPAPRADVPAGPISYSDIECDAPPGQTRGEFLDEVRYLGLPKSFAQDDPATEMAIRRYFESHPKVDRVIAVEERERRIAVKLAFKPG